MARRIGRKKAIVALAHSVLIIMYHVLRTKQPYAELRADSFDPLNTERLQHHHIRRLEQLGFSVTVTPKEAASFRNSQRDFRRKRDGSTSQRRG